MSDKVVSFLERCTWYSSLDERHARLIRSHAVSKLIQKQEIFFQRGDQPLFWCGVMSGLVRVSSTNVDGKVFSYGGLIEGGWFNETPILKNSPLQYEATALRDTDIVLIPSHVLNTLVKESLPFNQYLVNFLNQRVIAYSSSLRNQRTATVELSVAKNLAAIFNPVFYMGDRKAVDLSQEEIGYLCGLSRQRVNVAMKKLIELGLVKSGYRTVEIIDYDGLRFFSND
jgi:CRP-like cAMP-binding protein